MFDTMTVTKVGGALCGALLVFLLLNWLTEGIYSAEVGHGEHAEAAYVIEVEEEESHAETEEVAVDIVALVAAADVEKGAKVFSKCKACHKLEEGAKGTGPSLFDIVGKDIGSFEGFGYSGGMAELAGNWTVEMLNAFLTKPKDLVAGTKMSFSGLKKDSDRANLIAYLQTVK